MNHSGASSRHVTNTGSAAGRRRAHVASEIGTMPCATAGPLFREIFLLARKPGGVKVKHFRPLHKVYGGLRMIRVCRDWPKWFHEYFTALNDGLTDYYRMRCGINVHTRHNRSDLHMIDEIWAYRKYDYFGYRVAPGDVVVDIGGNIGAFSLYAARIGGASRVFSFEPFPGNYKILSHNVEQNRLRNVTCVNQAVAGSRGLRTLRLNSEDSGSHSLVNGSCEHTIEVECCTLEDVFARYSLTKIDYLKMDCEGAEYEILENAISRLPQIGRISMETHMIMGRKPEDLERLLQSHGFVVRRFEGSRLYASRLS
jgi:FkbM family methyltransferase